MSFPCAWPACEVNRTPAKTAANESVFMLKCLSDLCSDIAPPRLSGSCQQFVKVGSANRIARRSPSLRLTEDFPDEEEEAREEAQGGLVFLIPQVLGEAERGFGGDRGEAGEEGGDLF